MGTAAIADSLIGYSNYELQLLKMPIDLNANFAFALLQIMIFTLIRLNRSDEWNGIEMLKHFEQKTSNGEEQNTNIKC